MFANFVHTTGYCGAIGLITGAYLWIGCEIYSHLPTGVKKFFSFLNAIDKIFVGNNLVLSGFRDLFNMM